MFPMTTAPTIGAETNTSSAWMQVRHLAGRPRSRWASCARNTQWTDLAPTQQLPSRLRRLAVLTRWEAPLERQLGAHEDRSNCPILVEILISAKTLRAALQRNGDYRGPV
jgi:hypothetical protein